MNEHTTPDTGPRVTRDEMKDVGRMRRTTTDRHIAGVAGGIARHLDIDPVIVRVTLAVAVLFGGAGLLVYAAAWLLIPEEGSSEHPLGLDERSRVFALIGAGVLALLAAIGDWAGAFWFPWPLAIVAVIVLWYLNRKDHPVASVHGSEAPAYEQYAGPLDSYAAAAGTPAGVPYARPGRPQNPRRRGPILFWITLPLIALAVGVLGVIDLAGAAVTPSAYPALALGVTTAMLLLGSFWGRAGGLILIGLVAAAATAGTTAGTSWSSETVTHVPTSAAEVEGPYELGAGELVIDLSEVEDIENLDGREVNVDGFAGRVEVIVPDDVDVSVDTQIVGGDSRVFDRRQDGGDVRLDGFVDGGAEAPDLSISIDLVFGKVIVRTAD